MTTGLHRRTAIRLALTAAAGALVGSREARACGSSTYTPRTRLLDSVQRDPASLETSFQAGRKAGKPILVSIGSEPSDPFPYASRAGLDRVYDARDVAGLARLALYEITCLEPLHPGIAKGKGDRPSLLVGESEGDALRPIGPVRLEIRSSERHGRRQTEPHALKALFEDTDRNADRYAALCRAMLPATEISVLEKRLDEVALRAPQAEAVYTLDRTRIPDRALWEPLIRGAAIVLARALKAIQRDRAGLLDLLAWAELCHRESDPPAGTEWGPGPAEERMFSCGLGHVPLKSESFIKAYREALERQR